jgi:hypothetical protein
MFELVLTMPRTGSTYYVDNQARDLEIQNHGELFHTNRKKHTERILKSTDFQNSILKIFPSHIRHSTYKNLMEDLFAMNPTVTILLRKDFVECTKSFYVARHISEKAQRAMKGYNRYSKTTGEYIDPWHSSWDNHLEINLNQEIMNKYAETRMEEIQTLATYKNKMDRLIFTEDFPQELKYKRPIRWNPEPIIQDIDVLELFEQTASN